MDGHVYVRDKLRLPETAPPIGRVFLVTIIGHTDHDLIAEAVRFF
jgi:hypothetical protein